jgi:electron transport complex protein RnfB
MSTNIEKINACLPQTQCGECGYTGCKPYAEAMARGETTINHCPPGGIKTLKLLADLLKIDPTPYEKELTEKYRLPRVAFIQEDLCIGCMKCIQVCPVDAIVGTGKMMHTVLAQECTGCGLCVPPCPMDCIEMKIIPEKMEQEKSPLAEYWKMRHENHLQRLGLQQKMEKNVRTKMDDPQALKKAAIAEAIARAKAKREQA